jgi:Fe-S-cluster-containing hydrogenase component 2
MLESICPTKALKVVEDNIMIDPKACIACGDCLEVAPKGFLGSKIKRRL